MDKWTAVKRFRTLVAEQKVAPITCPDCKKEYVWLIDPDDEPILYCATDDMTAYPGIIFWQEMTAVVKEHYLD